MACGTCGGEGTITVGKGGPRPHERGCPDCAAGHAFERQLAREASAQRERDICRCANKVHYDLDLVPAQAGTGNAEGSRIEAGDDMKAGF